MSWNLVASLLAGFASVIAVIAGFVIPGAQGLEVVLLEGLVILSAIAGAVASTIAIVIQRRVRVFPRRFIITGDSKNHVGISVMNPQAESLGEIWLYVKSRSSGQAFPRQSH